MILIQLQEILGEYYNTYVTTDGNILYAYNNSYMYKLSFVNNKLNDIEITDVNIKDMKVSSIPGYLNHLTDRETEVTLFITKLNDFVNNVLLFDLDIPPGLTQDQQDQYIKTYLLDNYISSGIYNILRGLYE